MALVCLVGAISAQSAFAATTVVLCHMNERSGTVMHDCARNYNATIHNVRLGVRGFRGRRTGVLNCHSVTVKTGKRKGLSGYIYCLERLPYELALDAVSSLADNLS